MKLSVELNLDKIWIQFIAIKQFFETSVKIGRCVIEKFCTKNIFFFEAKKLFTIHNLFNNLIVLILMHKNYKLFTIDNYFRNLIILLLWDTHAPSSIFSKRETFNTRDETWIAFLYRFDSNRCENSYVF